MTGRKEVKPDREYDEDVYRLLRGVHDISSVAYVNQEPFLEMVLPQAELEVKYFRGSILDEGELEEISRNSSCVAQLHRELEVRRLTDDPKSPPLPFNNGQIALVMASGGIDGVITDDQGRKHMIKGRVIRRIDRETRYENEEHISVETTASRVEINILLPNGEHLALA